MYSEYYLSKLSFKSIFKLLFIPSLAFGLILSLQSYEGNTYPKHIQEMKKEIDPNSEIIKDISNEKLTKIISSSLIIGALGFNLLSAIWVWLCLKTYFFFFRLKIKATLIPVAHDQKDDPVGEQPLKHNKT